MGLVPDDQVLFDLNGDGRDDLLTVHASAAHTGFVQVRLSHGAAGLAPPVTYPLLMAGQSLAVAADATGDGVPDVVTLNYDPVSGTGSGNVLAGDGAGGLGAAVRFAKADGAFELATGDLDHDGNSDFVAFHTLVNDLSWQLGDGAGGFGTPVVLPVSGIPDGIVLGDLDLDGNLDAVTTVLHSLSGTSSVLVLLGDGTGGLAAQPELDVAARLSGGVLADVDADGALDYVAPFSLGFAHGVAVLLGNGAGSFASTSLQETGAASVAELTVADFSGDGRQDVLLTQILPPAAVVLTGNGFGQFGAAGSVVLGIAPLEVVTGDVDGDGRPDATVLHMTAGKVTLLRNTSTATPWTNMWFGLAGVSGVPSLAGTGSLVAGSAGALTLASARPSAAAALFVSLGAQPAPFKGGTLITIPVALTVSLVTDGAGGVLLPWASWPAGLPSGLDLDFQVAVSDAAAPKGVALSNGLEAELP